MIIFAVRELNKERKTSDVLYRKMLGSLRGEFIGTAKVNEKKQVVQQQSNDFQGK